MKKLFNLILLFFITINVFLSIDEMVLAQEDKEINQKITICDLKIREELEAINIDMAIPVIEGMKDKQVEDKINQLIQEYAFNFKKELCTESDEYLKDAKKEGWRIGKYQALSYYIVHYQSKNMLSVSIFYYRYTLGAHGHTLQKAYNINLKNGELFMLSTLFRDMEKAREVINKEIKRQIQLYPDLYFESGQVFRSISDNHPFYIIDGNIVIFFGLYEIAPYAYGIRYFKIPFSLIEMNIKF